MMETRVKGKNYEDLLELPLLESFNQADPAKNLKRCDVCNQPIEKVVGSEYKRYRKLVKMGNAYPDSSIAGIWESDFAWDYTNAKVVPDLADHFICERVRKLETANVIWESDSFLMRVKNRIGTLLHGIAESLQR